MRMHAYAWRASPSSQHACHNLHRRGTPDSVDRDANIALFQEAAATAAARQPAGETQGSRAAAAAGAAGTGGSTLPASSSGVERYLLVATYEGREAKASVPMQRCTGGGDGNCAAVACMPAVHAACNCAARRRTTLGLWPCCSCACSLRTVLLNCCCCTGHAGPRRRQWITLSRWQASFQLNSKYQWRICSTLALHCHRPANA